MSYQESVHVQRQMELGTSVDHIRTDQGVKILLSRNCFDGIPFLICDCVTLEVAGCWSAYKHRSKILKRE